MKKQNVKSEALSLKESIAAEAARLSEIRRAERHYEFNLSAAETRLALVQKLIAELHEEHETLPARKAECVRRLELLRKRFIAVVYTPQIEKLRQLKAILSEDASDGDVE